METTNLASAVNGDVGAGTAKNVTSGIHYFAVSGTDFTGVTVAFQYSHDNSQWVTIDSVSAAGGKVSVLPEGYVRSNITGGGAGDAITVKHGWVPLVKGNFIKNTTPVTVTAS